MKGILEDGLNALADLLQSGASSCHPETEERLERLAKEWEAAGLHTGAELLTNLGQALAQRRHGGGAGDPLNIMSLTGKAARYTRLCLQKYGLDAARERLNQAAEPEEDSEECEEQEETEHHETDS